MAVDYRRRSTAGAGAVSGDRRAAARRRALGRAGRVAAGGVAASRSRALGVWQLDRAGAEGGAAGRARRRAAAARRSTPPSSRATPTRPPAQHAPPRAPARPLARRAHRLPRQPADGRQARLLRASRRCALEGSQRDRAGAARLGAAQLRRPRRAAGASPRRPAGSRSRAAIAPPPAQLYRVRRGGERADPAKSRPRRVRARNRAAAAAAVGAAGRRRRSPPTACCATGRAPAADVQKHYGYAFQWFALARPHRHPLCLVPIHPPRAASAGA